MHSCVGDRSKEMFAFPTEHEARVRCIACGSSSDGSLPVVVTASSEGFIFVRCGCERFGVVAGT